MIHKVSPSDAIIIAVDLQKRFIEAPGVDTRRLLPHISFVLDVASAFSIPVIATLEAPARELGAFPTVVNQHLPQATKVFEKMQYDLCREDSIREFLLAQQRRQCVVIGAETDVCVLQSVCGLLSLAFDVLLVTDCIMSRSSDVTPAIVRMLMSGAVPTTAKSLYYEMRGSEESTIELCPPVDLPAVANASNGVAVAASRPWERVLRLFSS